MAGLVLVTRDGIGSPKISSEKYDGFGNVEHENFIYQIYIKYRISKINIYSY